MCERKRERKGQGEEEKSLSYISSLITEHGQFVCENVIHTATNSFFLSGAKGTKKKAILPDQFIQISF